MGKRAQRRRRVSEDMRSRVWFAPMGSNPHDPAVWRLMGVVKAVYAHAAPVYCLARIDPPFDPAQETIRPTADAEPEAREDEDF